MVTSPHSPRVRSFCPDQDFIEMDFDPGSDSNDESDDGDSGQGQDGGDEDVDQSEADEDVIGAGSMEDEDRVLSVSPPVQHLVLDSILLPPSNNNDPNKEPESHNQELEAGAAAVLLPTSMASPTYPASAPVLSPSDEVTILMPRSKSLNSSLGDCLMMAPDPPSRTRIANLSLCGSRLLQREALLFGGDGEEVNRLQPEPDLASALQRLTLPSTSSCNPLHPLVTQKAMIWTEKEAVRKQVEQRKFILKIIFSYS